MFQILWWIIVGLIVGALARFLVPGRDPMGWLGTIVLGIAGSFVGGFIGSLIWKPASGSRRKRFHKCPEKPSFN